MTRYIRLNQGELAECLQFAERLYERHKGTSQAGLIDHKGQDRINRDYISKAAEAAVAQYLGLPISFEVNQGRGGDGGYDLRKTLNDGTIVTIDVKSSTAPGAERLIWPVRNNMDKMADVLTFVTTGGEINSHDFGNFKLHGWVTGWQFKKLASIAPPGGVNGIVEGTRFMYSFTLAPIEFLL